MNLVEVIGPSSDLVTIPEARAQCRIPELPGGDPETDALLARYIRAARQYVEWRTGRTLLRTRWRLAAESWPDGRRFMLPRATPLIDVIQAVWHDDAGAEHSFADLVTLDTDGEPGALVLKPGASWPSAAMRASSPIVVVYDAGLDDASPEPSVLAAARQAILLIVAAMYENREAETVTNLATAEAASMRYGVESFLALLSVDHAIR